MAPKSRKRRLSPSSMSEAAPRTEATLEIAPVSGTTPGTAILLAEDAAENVAPLSAGSTPETAIVLAETAVRRRLGTSAVSRGSRNATVGSIAQTPPKSARAISAVGSSPASARASRGRQAKPVEEKRLSRFLPNPSRAVLDRIERAYVHRLYLIGFDWPRAPRAAGGVAGGAGEGGGGANGGAGGGGGAHGGVGEGRATTIRTGEADAAGTSSSALALPPPRTPLPHNRPPPQSPQSPPPPSQSPTVAVSGTLPALPSPAPGALSTALTPASSPIPTLSATPSAEKAPSTPFSSPPSSASPLRPCSCNFHVLGATGNVYTVTISQQPSCTCPDCANGNLCKHILFVLLRVLRVDHDDPRVWQRSLLSTELSELLDRIDALGRRTAAAAGGGASNARGNNGGDIVEEIGGDVVASQSVREQFARIAGGGTGAGGSLGVNSDAGDLDTVGVNDENDPKPKQRPIEGDCPICYEPMGGDNAKENREKSAGKKRAGKAAEAVVFCQHCGNNVHADCFARWKAAKQGGLVTCVWCRAPWEVGSEKMARPGREIDSDGGDDGAHEYVNLSRYSEAHQSADTRVETMYPDTHVYFGGRRRRQPRW